jgi:hypothetical protein
LVTNYTNTCLRSERDGALRPGANSEMHITRYSMKKDGNRPTAIGS